MRKLAMLLALAVAFTMSAFAQTSSSSQGTTGSETQTTTTKTTKKSKAMKGEAGESKAAEKAEGKESQLTGCLAKDASGNGFMLTNGRHKKGVEVKSSEDLTAHVGHEVKLMGTWEKPTSGEAGGAGPKGHEMRTFNASKIDHVADTCPAGGAAKGKKAKSEAKAPGF